MLHQVADGEGVEGGAKAEGARKGGRSARRCVSVTRACAALRTPAGTAHLRASHAHHATRAIRRTASPAVRRGAADGEEDADADKDLPFACLICRQPFVDPVQTKYSSLPVSQRHGPLSEGAARTGRAVGLLRI